MLNQLQFHTATLLTFPRSPLGGRERTPLTVTETRFWADAANAGFPQRHPVGRLLPDAIDPVAWSAETIADPAGELSRQSRSLPAIARRHGVAEVLFVPVVGAPHDVTVIALTARQRTDGNPAVHDLLAMAATAAFARMKLLEAQAKRNEIRLTQREAEVARWIAAGKSDWEIGQILEISAKTVNFHAENVKRKCGVATRVQAIAAIYGAMRGDFDPSPPT